ncbi:glycosyltransferase family 2 protein [Cyanobacterium stanieri LEGE 03274]|uniref:Glycosyltransferase family 2 protein n=1 Tax=Cyanobacterium stanieri LEGE 03274 TaxID=1828756 RepID=A0ABR9V0S4_9CHRO|nr:glycosyltransferase family 2 protein [Cyanobacterium stanieri]MBE9221486.1 glycosyltransferase family 2 protein [Cyanobacterium stanieri LEGE 03274]
MTKKVTIVTCTFNKGESNRASLQSIIDQTYQDFEYIIVNDGSTDNTKEILDEFTALDNPQLTIIHQKNKGFIDSLIDTLEGIDTPYIAIHGAGDISHLTRLEKQIELLESDSSIGAVGCHVRKLTHEGKTIRTTKDKKNKLLINDPQELFFGNYYTHGEVTFRRSTYIQTGGYRRFFKYAQDIDLWLRMLDFSKLAKIDSILYEQIYMPNSSVASDYKKVEYQAKLFCFAVFLSKQRLQEISNPIEAKWDKLFEEFCDNLDDKDKDFISGRIMETAGINYIQTRNNAVLANAARRVLTINPENHPSKRYIKLRILSIIDKFGDTKFWKFLIRKLFNTFY